MHFSGGLYCAWRPRCAKPRQRQRPMVPCAVPTACDLLGFQARGVTGWDGGLWATFGMPLSLPHPETCSALGWRPFGRTTQVPCARCSRPGTIALLRAEGCQRGVGLELMDVRYLAIPPLSGQRPSMVPGSRGSPHSNVFGALLNHVPCLDRPGRRTNEISSAKCFCRRVFWKAVNPTHERPPNVWPVLTESSPGSSTECLRHAPETKCCTDCRQLMSRIRVVLVRRVSCRWRFVSTAILIACEQLLFTDA